MDPYQGANQPDQTAVAFNALVTGVVADGVGVYWYQWARQGADAGTGAAVGLPYGPFGTYTPVGPSGNNPTIEVNNTLVPVGTYVKIVLRGNLNGDLLFDFQYTPPSAPGPEGTAGFDAVLTSTWNSSTGYSWKAQKLSAVAWVDWSTPFTGNKAVTPDVNTTLQAGQTGFLYPDLSPGSTGGWIFLPAGCLCTPGGPAPGAPTSPSVTQSGTNLVLTWTDPTGAPAPTQYVSQVSASATMSSPIQTVYTGAGTTTATLAAPGYGTTYYLSVYGLNGSTPGPYSTVVNITPVAAPTLSSAVIQSNGTSLVLTFSESVSGFTSGANGFALTGLSGGATTLTYASGNASSSVTMTISRTIASTETGGALAYTAGSIVSTTGSNPLASFSGTSVTNDSTQSGTTKYTTAGTYSFTATATSHFVQCWGGGGGGGMAAPTGAAGGGGGGEYRASTVTGLTIGSMYTVVVAASSTTAGNPSSFNSTSVVANGGLVGNVGIGGSGGSGGTGTTSYSGGNGGVGNFGSTNGGGGGGSSGGTGASGNAGSNNSSGTGGAGGTAPTGGGNGGAGGNYLTGSGTAGTAPGGGGGGGAATGGLGGAGAAGAVWIT